ncbi:hypothetical protein SVAN01_09999 [Stagonosporopsis vannaccii]|nr:hypothetical protein SVAN01_09999 [Stagonosporopsis vannaccii]
MVESCETTSRHSLDSLESRTCRLQLHASSQRYPNIWNIAVPICDFKPRVAQETACRWNNLVRNQSYQSSLGGYNVAHYMPADHCRMESLLQSKYEGRAVPACSVACIQRIPVHACPVWKASA